MVGFFTPMTGGPSVTFPAIGDSRSGTVVDEYTLMQDKDFVTDKPKVDDLGRPVMMACVRMQYPDRDPAIPNDDGIRTLYVSKVGMKIAISRAVQDAGAADLEIGGKLTVTWTGETPSAKGSPLKTWSASYIRPVGMLGNTPVTETVATTAAAEPDLVAIARAAQIKAAADRTAMEAKAAPAAATVTNGADPAADLLKIRELSKLGFEPQAINAAMPNYSMDAIAAVLAI